MNYLSAENLSKSYGERVLFQNLSFGLEKGDRVALIAANGSGKSTLMNIVACLDTTETGKVARRDGVRIAYLQQEPFIAENMTVQDFILKSDTAVSDAVSCYENALKAQAENPCSKTRNDFEKATALMDQKNAWDFERRMKELLNLFNINDLTKKTNELSGGQKKRLALAMTLLDNPDILLLDEPTNHLDIYMISWLEEYLVNSSVTLLTVSHDRYFLDRVCNHIFELHRGILYHHKGNYAYYLKKKMEREEALEAEKHKLTKFMKNELEWMSRSPSARTGKSKARINAYYETREKTMGPKPEKEIDLNINMTRIGGKILELKRVVKSYHGNVLLNKLEYKFCKGERLGITGKNGTGKTTLLDMIAGLVQPDSGHIVTGDTIVMGYYRQDGLIASQNKRVIDVVKDIAEIIPTANGGKLTASQFLQHFLFSPQMQYTPVSKLSGGEKKRLYLLTVLMKNPNFLILDEPTNDLDLMTLNRLEEFLDDFKGCLIIVSHDRYMLDRLSEHLFIFEGNGQIRDYWGTFQQYQMEQEEKEKREKASRQVLEKKEKTDTVTNPAVKTKLTFKEKLEYERLEKELESMEKEKKDIENEINTHSLDYKELMEKTSRISEILNLTDEKTLRWMELDEYEK